MEGRQRRSFTDDYKRQAVDLVASSGRSIGSVARNLGFAIRCCGAGWNNVGPGGADGGSAAPHNAGDAAVGGSRGGDRPFAARERAAAHGARPAAKPIVPIEKQEPGVCARDECRWDVQPNRLRGYEVDDQLKFR
jgi:hypothetical protein